MDIGFHMGEESREADRQNPGIILRTLRTKTLDGPVIIGRWKNTVGFTSPNWNEDFVVVRRPAFGLTECILIYEITASGDLKTPVAYEPNDFNWDLSFLNINQLYIHQGWAWWGK
jgi:hypothetical protein